MKKFKKMLSLATSAAIAASMFSAFAAPAGAKAVELASYDFESGEPWTAGGSNSGAFHNTFETDSTLNSSVYNLAILNTGTSGLTGNRSFNVTMPDAVTGDIIELSFDFCLRKDQAGNSVIAEFQDSSANDVFKITYDTNNKFLVNDISTDITQSVKTDSWYSFDAVLDFNSHKITSMTISQSGDIKYAQSGELSFVSSSASNIGKIAVTANKGSGGLYNDTGLKLDNFTAKKNIVLTYDDGKVTANESGTVIVASYDSNGRMTESKTYSVTANAATAVDASAGDKIMFWDSKTNAAPLADPITVGEPANTNKVYIDEPFTYDDQTIIQSANNTATSTPAPVTLGSIVYHAGRRNNGPIYDNEAISDNALSVLATSYGSNGRGTWFTFEKAGIPEVSELNDGQVLAMSFDIATGSKFTVTGYGEIAEGALGSASTVSVDLILDKSANKQYMQVADSDGNILVSSEAALTATTFSGMDFRNSTSGDNVKFTIDNLKVETKTMDRGIASVTVKDSSGTALSGAKVTIGGYTLTTGEDGTASALIPYGEYTAAASMDGYLDASATVTVGASGGTASFALDVNDQIPNELVIGGGQSLIAAPKTDDTKSTAAFTATVYDDAGKLIAPNRYSLSWAVYPTGTTTADSNVTIGEDGVVSVSKNFMAESSVAAYDVVATIEMKDAGQRGLSKTQTLYVGRNDVIYYEPIAWAQADGARNGSTSIMDPVTLPELSRIELSLRFGNNGTDGTSHRTLGIITNGGTLVGLQRQGSTIKAWTETASGFSDNWNQSGDYDKFSTAGELLTDYSANTDITVVFTYDRTNNTVIVSCGDKTVSLSTPKTATSFTGFKTGMYRNYNSMTINSVTVSDPDPDYLSIVGDEDFAKVYGTAVTRDYTLNRSIIVSGETFNWKVSPADQGVTVDNGRLSVAASAAAGTYTLTATSNVRATKTASLKIEIGGFQTISQENATIEGANTYGGIGQTGTYKITELIDSYGDDVAELLPAAVWTSDNTSVAEITSDGRLTVKGKGTATLTATITNGDAVSTFTVPVTVDIYFISMNATGNSTTVDTSELITSARDSAITGYQITTSKGGKLVKQTVVTTAPTTVDTTGADKLEIAPVFTVTGVTKTTSKTISVPADTYNFNITGASGGRFDPYVNDQMLANNMLQGGTTVNKLAVNDVVVNEGYATIKLEDAQSNSKAGTITIVKSPSIVDRVKKVYVLGDSLVCIYYNGGNATNNYQTGWGQVLQSYLTDEYEVVDLGNSGSTAYDLASTAITQVAVSGKSGDIMLLESGYNDGTRNGEYMESAVTEMYNAAVGQGVTPVLISPNASAHDFKASVAKTSTMTGLATTLNAKYINLSAMSYSFFTSAGYTNDTEPKTTYNVSDTLHSTYNGAQKMASIVAGGMIDVGLGEAVNTSYKYTFKDSLGNTITCQAAASN